MSDALLTHADMISAPIGEGDAGVIIKPDGSFQLFNTHKNLNPDAMTDAQLNQGEILVALSVALRHRAVLEMLISMSNDPDLCSQTELIAKPKLNS